MIKIRVNAQIQSKAVIWSFFIKFAKINIPLIVSKFQILYAIFANMSTFKGSLREGYNMSTIKGVLKLPVCKNKHLQSRKVID